MKQIHNTAWHKARALERLQYQVVTRRAIMESYRRDLEELEREFSSVTKRRKRRENFFCENG